MAHGRFASLTPPVYQAIPLTPVPGIQIVADPFGMQAGAVNFSLDTFLLGPSAIPQTLPANVNFTQGVLSFWARFDPSKSASGDSAKIAQTSNPNLPIESNTALTTCGTNQPTGAPGFGILPFQMGCIAIFIDILGVHLALADANTARGLIGASLVYQPFNDVNFKNVWVKLGAISALAQIPPFTWNGASFPFGAIRVMDPCGSDTLLSFNPCAPGSIQEGFSINSPDQLPPPMANSAAPVGPSPVLCVPVSQAQGDIWWVPGSTQGGSNPTVGWHHYICSFDTSQLVTDVNGNQSIRVQMAMDGAGGPLGGPLMDTKATAITLASQPFSNWSTQNGITGVLNVAANDTWVIEAPGDEGIDFAYCYFGASLNGQGFYDLTVPGNIGRFRTPQGQAANFGRAGIGIPLDCVFMHTGDMGNGNFGTPLSPIVSPKFPTNAAQPFLPISPTPIVPHVQFVPWLVGGRITSTDGPPINFTLSF